MPDIMDLRLAKGPVWHEPFIRKLAPPLVRYMVNELGTEEVLKRFADPLWYQTFGVLLGFEWQFSGATTVPLRILAEEGVDGLFIHAGKGERMLSSNPETLPEEKYALKWDNVVFQDGYEVYFHAVLSDGENVVVINQGMRKDIRMARRYHWLEGEKSSGKKDRALHLFEQSEELLDDVGRVLSLRPERVVRIVSRGRMYNLPYHLRIPRRISKKALEIARRASDVHELWRIKGVGKETVRALVYAAHLIYGTPLSWEDPVTYSYAFGTKAGIPFLVKTGLMSEVARFFEEALEEMKLGGRYRRYLLKRLSRMYRLGGQQTL